MGDCVCDCIRVAVGVFVWGYYRDVDMDVAYVYSWCINVGVGRTMGVHMNKYATGGDNHKDW